MNKLVGNKLGKALMDEGLCPENCSNVELHIPASGAAFVRFDVFITQADLPKVVRAISTLTPEEQSQESGTITADSRNFYAR